MNLQISARILPTIERGRLVVVVSTSSPEDDHSETHHDLRTATTDSLDLAHGILEKLLVLVHQDASRRGDRVTALRYGSAPFSQKLLGR